MSFIKRWAPLYAAALFMLSILVIIGRVIYMQIVLYDAQQEVHLVKTKLHLVETQLHLVETQLHQCLLNYPHE